MDAETLEKVFDPSFTTKPIQEPPEARGMTVLGV
jgi:hypothetical protein